MGLFAVSVRLWRDCNFLLTHLAAHVGPVTFDWLHRPTVTPSIHQLNACHCHFGLSKA